MLEHEYGMTSTQNLADVHPRLVFLAYIGLKMSPLDLGICSGSRSLITQENYVKLGVSWTLDSMHRLRIFKGFTHPFAGAFDFYVYAQGESHFSPHLLSQTVEDVFKPLAAKYNIPCRFGADWRGKKRDSGHIELAFPSKLYIPAEGGF